MDDRAEALIAGCGIGVQNADIADSQESRVSDVADEQCGELKELKATMKGMKKKSKLQRTVLKAMAETALASMGKEAVNKQIESWLHDYTTQREAHQAPFEAMDP